MGATADGARLKGRECIRPAPPRSSPAGACRATRRGYTSSGKPIRRAGRRRRITRRCNLPTTPASPEGERRQTP